MRLAWARELETASAAEELARGVRCRERLGLVDRLGLVVEAGGEKQPLAVARTLRSQVVLRTPGSLPPL